MVGSKKLCHSTFLLYAAAEVHSVWDHLAGPQTTLKDYSQYSFTSLVKGHLAKLSSVTLVLNVKKWTIHAQIFDNLPKKRILPLVSILTTVIRWIPQHLLVLQTGNKKFSLFTCFFFHCLLVEVALQYTMASDPVMSDKLTSQSVVRFGHITKTSSNLFLWLTSTKKSPGDVLVKWLELLCQVTSAVLRTAFRYSGVPLLRPLTVQAEVWPSKKGGPGSLVVLYRVQMY